MNENQQKAAVSVIVHVLNEEINLSHALKTVCGRFDEVFVVDAGSTDKTPEIAKEFGATFIQIKGDKTTLVKQRNWALENLPFKHDWVYIHDADEQVPDDLFEEICECVNTPKPDIDGYWVRYKEIILHRWLKRSGIYPNWGLRLFKHAKVRYEDRAVNAHVKIDHERSAQIQAHFIHDDKRGFKAYIKRLSSITVIEANSINEIYNDDQNLMKGSLFSSSVMERRRALKRIYYRLPFRPVIIFTYLYFIRMGFLEGRAGLYNCLYRACHELFVSILQFEAKGNNK